VPLSWLLYFFTLLVTACNSLNGFGGEMKFYDKCPKYLSAHSTMREMVSFAWSSIDGRVTIIVSLFSIVLGVLFFVGFLPNIELVNHVWLLFIPVLLCISFIRMRLYTYSDDWFSIVCYFPIMLVVLSIPLDINIGDIVCYIRLYLNRLID